MVNVTEYTYPKLFKLYAKDKPLVLRALGFAEIHHAGSKRKYSNLPEISHPVEVATWLISKHADIETVIAALLHDTVEDTDATIQDIEEIFGQEIAHIVNWQTQISKPEDGNRKYRSEKDNRHYAKGCIRARRGKFSDVRHNCMRLHLENPKFAKTYFVEKWNLIHILVCDELLPEFYDVQAVIQLGATHIGLELPKFETDDWW